MLCLFCSSKKHPSRDCSIYVTDEERRMRIRKNKRCQKCLSIFKNHPGSGMECKKLPKCYICLTQDHHTLFCPTRFTVLNLFPPVIDQNLFSRFLEMLTIEEQYFMAFSFPLVFSLLQIKQPLNVYATQWERVSSLNKFNIADLVVVDFFEFGGIYGFNTASNVESFSSPTIFRIRHLEIRHSPFSSEIFLQLLSYKTKSLNCANIKFQPLLTFSEILKKAPYLEEINLNQTNIENDNSWPNDLVQFNQASNFKELLLSIEEFEFCVETLAKFIKTKSAYITLYVNHPKGEQFFKNISLDMIKDKLSPHFVPAESALLKSLRVLNKDFACDFKLHNF